jgi:RNA polymerase sigma-B factor
MSVHATSAEEPAEPVAALEAAGGVAGRPVLRAGLITALLPLAHRLAARYRGLGVPLEDLRQVAAAGLIKSVDGYRPEEGGFLGYAVPTITGEIRRYLRDRAWAVRPPRRLQELALRIGRTAERLVAEHGRMPTAEEIAGALHESVDEVHRGWAARHAYIAVSLDEAAGPDTAATRADLLAGPDPGIEATVDRLALAGALAGLDDRQRDLIRMRFGEELTQQQIATRLGVSQAHVSGLLAATLRDLRTEMEETAPACRGSRQTRRATPRHIRSRTTAPCHHR